MKCECNEHASSCVYNQSLDTSPNSRTQGGGGVCIDCQHNTTGRFCEVCKERFYRESGKSLKTSDVCSPCGCEGPGVQSGKLDCVKVSALLSRDIRFYHFHTLSPFRIHYRLTLGVGRICMY